MRSREGDAVPIVAASLVVVAMGLGPMPGTCRAEPASTEHAGQPIRQVLREAARAAGSSPDADSRIDALVEIAGAQARAGDRDGAVRSARQAAAAALTLDPKGQGSALPAIAWAREAAGDRAGALNVLLLARRSAAGISRAWERMVVLKSVAGSQADLGARDAARATIQEMREIASGASGDLDRLGVLGELVAAQAYCGDVDGAFRTVEDAAAGRRRVQGHLLGEMAQAVTAGAASSLQPRKAIGPEDLAARRRVLERIDRMVETFAFAEEKPSVKLAIALARAGDDDRALRVARRMATDPVRHPSLIDPTALPYVLAMIGSYQGKAGHREEARATFREALDLIRRDPRLSSRLGQVGWGQGVAGDLEEARKTLAALDPRQRIEILDEIADRRDEAGDDRAARAARLAALEEAERLLPAETALQRKDDDLSRIAALRARLGHLDAALAAFRTIAPETRRRQAASAIAEARSRAGDAEGALAWALTLEPPGVRAWAMRGLGRGTLARP